MAPERDIRELAKLVLIGLGLFLLGGLIAFGYSWRPLHGGLRWKVADLEERLDQRNRENLELGAELAELRSTLSGRVEPEAVEQIEKELEKTRSALAKAEKGLERSERERREQAQASTRWRKRFEELRDARPTAASPSPALDAAGSRPAAVGEERSGAGGIFPTPAGPSASGSGASARPDRDASAVDSPTAGGNGMLSPAEDDPTRSR